MQEAAAKRVGLDQAKISRLLLGNTTGFSTERLFKVLNALGRNVEIKVLASRKAIGETRVTPGASILVCTLSQHEVVSYAS